MQATQIIQPLLELAEPLTSPLLVLLVALILPSLLRRGSVWPFSPVKDSSARRTAHIAFSLIVITLIFSAGYHLASSAGTGAAKWLAALNSPLATVLLIVILPAMHMKRGTVRYKLFLAIPFAFVLLMIIGFIDSYLSIPAEKEGFRWFLIRPAYLMAGVASLLVLVQPLFTLTMFRRIVRITCVAVLIYGGFAFRQDYLDYDEMMSRRRDAKPGIMNLSETSPVLKHADRKTYLPAAPCRFSADGGYVQGCVLEMLQRVAQMNFGSVMRRDPASVGEARTLFAAMLSFLVLSLLFARAFCGWICPLATIGGALDWIRKLFKMERLRHAQPIKLSYLIAGLTAGGLGLALARAYAFVDKDEKFLGCKIPLYPFCKICPSQQVCPVAAHGLGNYQGLPTWDWGFGLFRIATVSLLVLFLFSFIAGRRLWCRFCPIGMISGLFNRGGHFALKKDANKCNRCGICAEVCPVDIEDVRDDMQNKDVSTFDCHLCMECVAKCPRDGCLSLEHCGGKVIESKYKAEN